MALDRDTLLHWPIPDIHHTYTERDTILYALGLGLGAHPTDENELRFTYEQGLQALPSMAVMLGYPGFWVKEPGTGVNWQAVVHGEQAFTNLKPLPPAGTVIGRSRVTDVIDKGPGKGVLLVSEREVVDAKTGDVLSRLDSTLVLRADGGCGGPSGPVRTPHPIPERAADHVYDQTTLPQAALIYRLNGDYNPLHADPQVAALVKFPRPILHGLCTFGVACHALLRTVCDYRPERLSAMRARFTSPVFPGETLRTEIWVNGNEANFRTSVVEREVVALNNGHAQFQSS